MKVEAVLSYKLEFTPAEYGLINRALRRSLKPEEMEDAKKLQRAMAEQKISSFNHYYNEIEKLKSNLDK